MNLPDIDLDTLDPGIRRTVAWLRSKGFDTTDSGDGKTKLELDPTMECALDYPHVAMVCAPDLLVCEARRLAGLLAVFGIELVPSGRGEPTLGAMFDPADGSALLVLTGVTDEMLPAHGS